MQQRSGGTGRGQVIIVTALVIASIFVGLALVLNSGIYAENLSSRETTDTEGALSFTLSTDEAIAEAYERTNRNESATADGARTTFNDTVDRWESAQQRRGAEQGIGVDVERTPHVGWRLNQSADREFTDDDGNGNWTLATGTSNVATFEMAIQQDSLYDAATWGNVNSSFNVHVTDGTAEWRLFVFQEGGDVVVHAGVPGAYSDVSSLPSDETCRQAGSRVVVDLQNESLDDSACDALNFSDDLTGPVDVRYQNATNGGEQVNGTYDLVVNGSSAAVGGNFDDPTGADPTATAVVYSASWGSHYGRAELTHERNGRYMVRGETYAG